MKDANKERELVIGVLNKARSMELYSIHQYMIQHYTLDDLDYGAFAGKVKKIAIEEMDHAERFAERIKEIGGEPVSELSASIQKGQPVYEVFPFDKQLENSTIASYNAFLKICRENGDSVSARLFEDILDKEQEHENTFNDIAVHITTLGDTYLAKIAGTDSLE